MANLYDTYKCEKCGRFISKHKGGILLTFLRSVFGIKCPHCKSKKLTLLQTKNVLGEGTWENSETESDFPEIMAYLRHFIWLVIKYGILIWMLKSCYDIYDYYSSGGIFRGYF